MSRHQGGNAEDMADEFEMEDVEDDMDDESIDRERGGVESDIDDYDHSVCKVLLYILQFVLFYEYNVDEYVVLWLVIFY